MELFKTPIASSSQTSTPNVAQHSSRRLKKLLRIVIPSDRQTTTLFPTVKGEIINNGKLLDAGNLTVYILSSVMVLFLTLSIGLNIYEGTYSILPPLVAAVCVAVLSIVWVRWKGTYAQELLFILNVTLMLIGLFLFVRQGAPDGSSLFWFVVFPPMAMVSLGLRRGTVVFLGFFFVLYLLLFTRMDAYLVREYSRSIRIRFMLAMFGAFLFSWWVEYLRHKAHALLVAAIRELERDALIDPLTGLANRRDFYKALSKTMSGCRRKSEPYVLALIDIDHFKRINDTLGHQTGDKVLRHIAATIANQVRDTDHVCRWGGEEFAVIIPGCTAEQAYPTVERIRSQVEATPYVEHPQPPLHMTVSIGFYCGLESGDPDYPLRMADAHLYSAKAAGRNRVVSDVAEEEAV